MQSVNNIWGRALNPWDKSRTTGGSSGGEAGLIASRCSPIGFGSDGVGSLRIPASFCGVYSFKPTKGRTTTKGHTVAGIYGYGKFTLIHDQNGPLARNVDDCMLIFKSILSKTHEHDVTLPHVEWNEEKFNDTKSLKIAYITSDDFIGACKTAKRAVKEAAEALKKQGHEIIETKIPNLEELIILTLRVLLCEGRARGTISFLGGETPVKEIRNSLLPSYLPNFLLKPLTFLLKILGENRSAKILQHMKDSKTHEYLSLVCEYFEAKNKFFAWWKENGFDGIILPAVSLPACKHGIEDTFSIAYNFPANVGNLPTGCIPITKIQQGEETLSDEDYKFKDQFYKIAKKNMEGSVGMPMSVQVWTLPYQDEKCFRIMKAIESEVNFHEYPKI